MPGPSTHDHLLAEHPMKARAVKAPGICRLHYSRERRLEIIGGIECVVGTCRHCGRK
jgi:hypothetical protein